MSIKNLSIENFTVFKNINIDFSPGINILIGENGTGKTHLLKLLYVYCNAYFDFDGPVQHKSFSHGLLDAFQNTPSKELIRWQANKAHVEIDGCQIEINDKNSNKEKCKVSSAYDAIYIPSKDMLTHSGIEHDFRSRMLPFDSTQIDILNKAKNHRLRYLAPEKESVLKKIADVLDGEIKQVAEKFIVISKNGHNIRFETESEGRKKFALLYQLLLNQPLGEGTVLLWDEPEANVNPKLVSNIVEILFELARLGVQIFLATHDYNLMKYFNVKKNNSDKIAFISLYKTADGVAYESEEDYSLLEHNSIVEASIKLLEDDLDGGL